MSGSKKKPGMFKRMFSSRKMTIASDPDIERSRNEKKLLRRNTVDTAFQHLTKDDEFHGSNERRFTSIESPLLMDSIKEKKPVEKQKHVEEEDTQHEKDTVKTEQPNGKASKGNSSPAPGSGKIQRKGSLTKKKKKSYEVLIKVDVSKPIDWPCCPEVILAFHKTKSILNPTEEWLIVELNEYECLIEDMDIIKKIAKHSKFFEVEPDELVQELFEFVEEVPTYDEIINYDVWQEFRDKKYLC